MTQLMVRAYDPVDFTTIEVEEHCSKAREGQPIHEWAQYHATHGPAFTVVDPQDRVVACVGVHHRWQGLGEIWMVFSTLAAQYLHIVAVMRTLIEYVQKERGYCRLQAAIDIRWPAAIRFAEHMGFQREALMKRYGPDGADHFLYALVQEAPND